MKSKYIRVIFDLVIILILSILSGIIVNELRADKIPLLPSYIYDNHYRTMSLHEFEQKESMNLSGFFFDARPHELYEKNHPAKAKNFPVSEFDFFYHLHLDNIAKDKPVFIYGRTLSKAYDLELAHLLHSKGHNNITVILQNENV